MISPEKVRGLGWDYIGIPRLRRKRCLLQGMMFNILFYYTESIDAGLGMVSCLSFVMLYRLSQTMYFRSQVY